MSFLHDWYIFRWDCHSVLSIVVATVMAKIL